MISGTNIFVYAYLPGTDIVSGYGCGDFAREVRYEQSRDLIASVTNRFGNRAISSFTYGNDAAGRRVAIGRGGEAMGSLAGSVDSYGYNARNEVVSAHRTLDGSAVSGFSEGFSYDPIGNRITATEHDESGTSHVSNYTANELNQYVSRSVPGLVSARGFADTNAFVTVNGNEAFRMGEYYFGSDQFDNSAQTGFAGVETYAALNCETNDLVSAVTNVAFLASSTESFIYDEDGNLVEDARFKYFWNGENRMIRAEEKIAPPGRAPYVVICAYDHMGRNVVKDGAKFIWDDYNIIVENVGASNETHNVWGLDLNGTIQGAGGVGGLLAVERSGAVAFPVYDANGNITEYVSGGGEILSHREYSSFGRELVHTGSDDFTYRFSTKPYCKKTGMVEFQLRRYRPWCGRWMNRDAIEEEGGLNLYGFSANIPIRYYDILGLTCTIGTFNILKFAISATPQSVKANLSSLERNAEELLSALNSVERGMSALSLASSTGIASLLLNLSDELMSDNMSPDVDDFRRALADVFGKLRETPMRFDGVLKWEKCECINGAPRWVRQSDIKISNDVPSENTGVNESYRVDVRNTYKDVEKELIRNMYNRLR